MQMTASIGRPSAANSNSGVRCASRQQARLEARPCGALRTATLQTARRSRGVALRAAGQDLAKDGEGFTASPFQNPDVDVGEGEAPASSDMELTVENADKVLDDVRPFLIADGGNCEVAGISNGVVMIEMQGACGSCPSSTATLKMGIEKALKAVFGDKLLQVVQVKKQEAPVDLEAVDAHLDMLRPAIVNYGGSCDVLEVAPPTCRLKYVGPAPIRQGIQAAIKDKFPTILEVEFAED